MIGACGSAGGRLPGQPIGAAGAQFRNTSRIKEGNLGSKLPPMPSQALWKAGHSYEVGWTVAANHGGGYAYRMAPLNSPLSEATFHKMPLNFDGPSILRWDGDRRTEVEFNSSARGWETDKGTTPAGSQWRRTPSRRGCGEERGRPSTWCAWSRRRTSTCTLCMRVARRRTACASEFFLVSRRDPHLTVLKLSSFCCRCSRLGEQLSSSLEVVDRVLVPKGTPPGRYVLQW